MSFLAPFPGGAAVGILYLDHQESGTSGSSITFSGLSFGVASSGRYLAACITWNSSPNHALASCTIGGVAATILTQVQSGGSGGQSCAIAIALVPTGTSGSVVANFGGSVVNFAVELYSVLGIQSPAASSVATSVANAPTATLAVQANGGVLGVGRCSRTTPSATWAGITKDADVIFGGICATSASNNFATAQAALVITCTFTSTVGSAGAFAAFAP